MWIALLVLAAMPEWIPARWNSADPKSLELIAQTPINCVLLEQANWSLAKAAAARNIAALGVVHPGAAALEQARQAVSAGAAGVVLDGDFEPAVAGHIRDVLSDSKIPVVELSVRYRMPLDAALPVIGTNQGVWPGIQTEPDNSVKAAPSGAAWIYTNTGFLRFARAASKSLIWVGVTPPEKNTWRVERYLQAIADAAMSGARWVVALDPDFEKRLLDGDAPARKDWARIGQMLRFYEDHKDWRDLPPHGLLALVQDVPTGALLSGGILDMIAVKHTPVRPVPVRRLKPGVMGPTKMAVDVDPESLTTEQKDVLKSFTRAGGTLLSGPPGWKFPSLKESQITLSDEDTKTLDNIWKEVNAMTGRRTLGARLFNVSSMLSNLLSAPDGKGVILHLVNYSDYPVEGITAQVLGQFKHARLYTPDGEVKELETYPVDEGEGTGVDIDKLAVSGIVKLD
jgi:hypothetical protein